MLSACFAHDHCVWCGPDDVQKDFSRIFRMEPVETGDAYFVASAPEVRQDEDVFAKRRKMWIDRESLGKHQCLSGEDLVALLPVGVRSRLADHSTLAGETHLADVMQNVPSKGGRATVGPLWPTQLTNSAIWSWRMNRMACKLEHAQALGVHACAAGTTPLFGLSPLGEIFAGMSRTEVIHLCGNSMHLSTQLAWMCYVFCNIGFKSDPFDFFSFKRATTRWTSPMTMFRLPRKPHVESRAALPPHGGGSEAGCFSWFRCGMGPTAFWQTPPAKAGELQRERKQVHIISSLHLASVFVHSCLGCS